MNERTSIDLVPNLIKGHGRTGRTKYDKEAKGELVRRCLEPGVSLAGMALAHGINANLLRRWVVQSTGKRRRVVPGEARLVPVVVSAPAEAPASEGILELVVPGGTVRVRGRIEETLRIVLDCLASRA